MTILSVIVAILLLIPVVPLIVYLIGMIVPATHVVSRSSTFRIPVVKLWSILTDVSRYPGWQNKVQDVIIDEIDINVNESKKVVFVEYSTSKRKTLVINHELIPFRCLIRVLEESPQSIIGNKYQFNNKTPTFSGSWTFNIIQEKEDEHNQVTLKITEQGVIKNPFARVTHLLLLRYHYRIDRFLNDLHVLVNKENQLSSDRTDDEQKRDNEKPLLNENDRHEGNDLILETQIDGVINAESNKIVNSVVPGQMTEATDNSLLESKIIGGDKEWDLVSEVYERPSQPKT